VQHAVIERDTERHTHREHRGHGDAGDNARPSVRHGDVPLPPNGMSRSAVLGTRESIVHAAVPPTAADSNTARLESVASSPAAVLAMTGSESSFGELRTTATSAIPAATDDPMMSRDHRAAYSHHAIGLARSAGRVDGA
jgi:hypothetical protein